MKTYSNMRYNIDSRNGCLHFL